ncbi:MAG: LPS export ABC transporter periplasmic protein LptC [Gemmatimonadetes bacterium]|nr:LPS export ABC transporter periplasmic protein LptC [Gemmatimonadota bacterium]
MSGPAGPPGVRSLGAICLALGSLAIGGCEKESQKPLASDTLLGLEADQVLVGVEMNLTRAGVRNAVLVADTAFSFQEEGLLQLRNLVITFYGASGLEEGVLTGREGEYRFESGDVEVTGEVEVTEAVGSKRLVTDRLRYAAEADSLYGDTAFVLYRPGLEMRGASFVSDAQLENVQSLNPSFVSQGDPTSAAGAPPE